MNVINTILANWETGLAVIGGLVAVATTIVVATPSQKDDAVLAKIVKIVNWLSVVNPKPAKV